MYHYPHSTLILIFQVITFHSSCESLSGSLDSVEPLVAINLSLGEFSKSGVFLELRNFGTSKT